MNNKNIRHAFDLYKNACNALLDEFIKQYFPKENDYCWIGDDIGGVVCVNSDFYFGIAEIIEALKEKPTFNELYNYYNYCYECRSENIEASVPNLKYFLKNRPDLKQKASPLDTPA